MGHYVLNHIYKGLAFAAVMMLAGFWLGRRIVLAMLARWGVAWRIRDINDLAALPVLMLALSLLMLWLGNRSATPSAGTWNIRRISTD